MRPLGGMITGGTGVMGVTVITVMVTVGVTVGVTDVVEGERGRRRAWL